MNEKQKAVQITEENARILIELLAKMDTETVIDLYGRKAAMRTIMKALQALVDLQGALVAALQEE